MLGAENLIEDIIELLKQQLVIYKEVMKLIDELYTDENSNTGRVEENFGRVLIHFDNVKEVENKLRILKQDYIKKNNIKEFNISSVKNIEAEPTVKIISQLSTELSEVISYVKKRHDSVVSRINNEYNLKKISKNEQVNKKLIDEKYKKIQKTK